MPLQEETEEFREEQKEIDEPIPFEPQDLQAQEFQIEKQKVLENIRNQRKEDQLLKTKMLNSRN